MVESFGYFETEFSESIKVVKVFEKLFIHFKAMLATNPKYKIWVTISDIAPKKKKLKTHAQLGYLYSAVLPIMAQALKSTGELNALEDEVKFWLKVLCSFGSYILCAGKPYFMPKSFANATVEEIAIIIDRAIFEAAERGFYIPQPTKARELFKIDEVKNA